MLPELTPLRTCDYIWLGRLNFVQCQALTKWLLGRMASLQANAPEQHTILCLRLTERACNALLARRLHTIADLEAFGLERLHLIRGIGKQTAEEIRTAVEGLKRRVAEGGLSL